MVAPGEVRFFTITPVSYRYWRWTITSTNTGTDADCAQLALVGFDLPRVPWEGGSSYWSAWPKAAASGWNSPTFFPIAVFLGKPESGHPAALQSIGINTYVAVEHNPPLTAVTDLGMFVIAQYGEWSPAEVGSNSGVVGWFTFDECEQGEGECGAFPDEADRLAFFKARTAEVRALADGRFVFANFGNGVLGTFWAPTTMDQYVQDVDGSGVDKYTYTSGNVRFEFGRASSWTAEGGTEANAQSSASYGWMARRMTRVYNDQDNMTPFWQVVETKMPYIGDEVDKDIITYAQIEGAVWSAIANEARGIIYFQHNGFYDSGTPPTIDPNTGVAPTTETYSLVDGSTGLKTAVTTLNSRVTALAPVINTQSYVFNFGATGVDTMLKVYGGYAYIFASLGVAAATGSKTFTLTGSGINGTSVEVLNESRSISVTGGQLVDSFANEYSHHIYKIATIAELEGVTAAVIAITGKTVSLPSDTGGVSSSIVFEGTDTDNATLGDNQTYTFTLTVASAAGQERLVAIAGVGSPAATVSFDGVTIDGQAATRVGSVARGANDGGGVCSFVTFYRAVGTSGTNINVVVTSDCPSGAVFCGYCAVWTLNDAGTLLASTNAASNDPTLNTNTVSDGVAVAALLGYSSGGGPTVAWTGLTERFDSVRVFSDQVFSGASSNIASGSTPLTISADITPDLAASIASICVSFNP